MVEGSLIPPYQHFLCKESELNNRGKNELIENLRSATRPAQRRASKQKNLPCMLDKNCE